MSEERWQAHTEGEVCHLGNEVHTSGQARVIDYSQKFVICTRA